MLTSYVHGSILKMLQGSKAHTLFWLFQERTHRKEKHMDIKKVANAMDNVVFEAKDELSRATALGKHEVVDNLVYYYHNIDLVADEVAESLHLDEDEYESFYIQFEQEHKALMSWLDVICKMYQ